MPYTFPPMEVSTIRKMAQSHCFGQLANHLPASLASDCQRLSFYRRGSSILSDLYEDLEERVVAWCNQQEALPSHDRQEAKEVCLI
jgi:hypothetical protein